MSIQSTQIPLALTRGGQEALRQNLDREIESLSDRFVKAKLVEHGFVGRTAAAQIRLMSTDSSREVTKLSNMLLRRVVKGVPYIEHLTQYQTDKLVSSHQGTIRFVGYVYSDRAVRQISRYVRYVNYRMLKATLPMRFGEILEAPQPSGLGIKITLPLDFCAAYPHNVMADASEEALQEALTRAKEEAASLYGSEDAVFSRANGESWNFVKLRYLSRPRSSPPPLSGTHNYSAAVPELIFLELPSILKFVENLTRKLMYGPSAFSVVSPAVVGPSVADAEPGEPSEPSASNPADS